jgi:hypothetical protein
MFMFNKNETKKIAFDCQLPEKKRQHYYYF